MARLYREAIVVYGWLGESVDDGDYAIDVLFREVSLIGNVPLVAWTPLVKEVPLVRSCPPRPKVLF
jgi:hypothetical protein